MKKKFISEFFGTTFLLMTIVGSGIMAESLSSGNQALILLINSLATGAGLFVLIRTLGPISGAHFNPIVSLVEFFWRRLDRTNLILNWVAQFLGAITGVLITHLMFNQTLFQLSSKLRVGTHLYISEIIATFGLICVISLSGKKSVEKAPLTIASYVAVAYWFSSSTSFANPAVTVARMLTNTFCGINPIGVLPFIIAQLIGGFLAFMLLNKAEIRHIK